MEKAAPPGSPTIVTVDLGPRSYDILIGRGVLDRAGFELAMRFARRAFRDRHRRDGRPPCISTS